MLWELVEVGNYHPYGRIYQWIKQYQEWFAEEQQAGLPFTDFKRYLIAWTIIITELALNKWRWELDGENKIRQILPYCRALGGEDIGIEGFTNMIDTLSEQIEFSQLVAWRDTVRAEMRKRLERQLTDL